jgi:hypothetical protein
MFRICEYANERVRKMLTPTGGLSIRRMISASEEKRPGQRPHDFRGYSMRSLPQNVDILATTPCTGREEGLPSTRCCYWRRRGEWLDLVLLRPLSKVRGSPLERQLVVEGPARVASSIPLFSGIERLANFIDD